MLINKDRKVNTTYASKIIRNILEHVLQRVFLLQQCGNVERIN